MTWWLEHLILWSGSLFGPNSLLARGLGYLLDYSLCFSAHIEAGEKCFPHILLVHFLGELLKIYR